MMNNALGGKEPPHKTLTKSHNQNRNKTLSLFGAGIKDSFLDTSPLASKYITQQGMAVEYAKMGFDIFPCDLNKAPIVDYSLGFVHGHKEATTGLRLIAKTWYKYPNAAIGFALPPHVVVFDCDVEKDSQKRPILKDGKPKLKGLESLKDLADRINLSNDDFDTFTTKTQSGGFQIFYKMPPGIPSFCHNHAMEGLDLKGYGGYVILPNSQGQYGRYEFRNLTKIRPIPEALLKWILQFRETKNEVRRLSTVKSEVDRDAFVRIIEPYWAKGDGRRNELTLAIAGALARSGGTSGDAMFIISELARLTGKGRDHIAGSKYAFNREGAVKGWRSLEQLMEEIDDN